MGPKYFTIFACILIFNIYTVASTVGPNHFKSLKADVTLSGTTYYNTTFYADISQNGQQIIYPFLSGQITETELYQYQARYQICSSNCNAYHVPYHIPNYALTGLTATSTKVINGISTTYYSYNDGTFLVELWYVGAKPVQVRQSSGSSFDRTIFFNDYNTLDTSSTVTLSQPNPTTYPSCATAIQCGNAMDVVLVIDTSGSITPDDYVREQTYVKSVVNSFTVGPYGVHIGFITFSTNPVVRVNLTDSASTVLSVISNTAQDKGETDIGDAIYAAMDLFKWGGRSNVPQVVIFLTDGNANLPYNNTYALSYYQTAAADRKSVV